jgi:hypothetical protein
MKPPYLVIIGIFVFCAVGFYVGRMSSPSPNTNISTASTTPPPRPKRDASLASEDTTAKITKRIDRPEDISKRKDVKLDTIMRGVDAVERCQQLLAYIDNLAPDEFEAALTEFRRTGLTSQRNSEYSMLISAWAKIDPISALEYAKKEAKTSFESETILAVWTTRDPEAAILWANNTHNGEGANPHLIGIIRALASTDLNRSTDLLLSMPRTSERGAAFDGIQSTLLSKGMVATQEWLDNLPDPELRTDAITRFVSSLAYTDPDKAIELMDQQNSPISKRITLTFVSQAFHKNPQIAIDQIARLQDADSRELAYSKYVPAWIHTDKASAVQWLDLSAGKDPTLQKLNLKYNQ